MKLYKTIHDNYDGVTITYHWFRLFGHKYQASFNESSLIITAETLPGLKSCIDVELNRQMGMTMKALKG